MYFSYYSIIIRYSVFMCIIDRNTEIVYSVFQAFRKLMYMKFGFILQFCKEFVFQLLHYIIDKNIKKHCRYFTKLQIQCISDLALVRTFLKNLNFHYYFVFSRYYVLIHILDKNTEMIFSLFYRITTSLCTEFQFTRHFYKAIAFLLLHRILKMFCVYPYSE